MNNSDKNTIIDCLDDNFNGLAKRTYLLLSKYDVDSQIRDNGVTKSIRFQFNIPSTKNQHDIVKMFEKLNAQYITIAVELNYGNTGVTMFCYNFGSPFLKQ